MLKAFDGQGFRPHGLLQSLFIQLGGEIVSINVEVVDVPLYYNLFLRRRSFYDMTIIASSVFDVSNFFIKER